MLKARFTCVQRRKFQSKYKMINSSNIDVKA